MKIILNGQEKELAPPVKLNKVVEQFCQDCRPVIAEVNGRIVKSQAWNETTLSSGDTVELVNFVGGG